MFIRVIAALMSTVVCFLYIVRPTSVSIFQENHYVLYALFIIIFGYLALGIPASYLIDKANQKILISSSMVRYFFNVVLYGMMGMLAVYFLFVILEGELIIKDITILFGGGVPALIFYHVLLLIKGLLFMIQIKINKSIKTDS